MSDNKTCSTKKNQIVKLGDILEVLTDYHSNGSYKTLKENVTLLEQPNFAIMIRTTNFEKNDFRKNLIYINQQAYNFLSKSKVLHQDILINKIANAGAVYFMPRLDKPVSLGMNLFLLRIKKDYNKYFIFCILKYNEKRLRLMAKGTTTKTITKDNIKMFQILLPPLETQQKIARTLSILDQKIENNHKINELLHKILELLYEQYFVRFDFLDENNKPYQTSGGKMKFSKELNRLIPNDFEVKTLGELVDIFSGYSFQSNTYSNNKNDYILITNKNVQHSLVDLSITTNLLFLPKKLPKYCLLEPTNILITLTGHIGRCALVFSKNCILNQRVGVVLPKEKELNPFYYSLIRNPLFSAILQRNAIGSSQQNLSPIDTLKIQIPFNHKIIKQYSKTCENIIKLLVSNMQSTQTLTAFRDFLLPLLLKQQVKPQ